MHRQLELPLLTIYINGINAKRNNFSQAKTCLLAWATGALLIKELATYIKFSTPMQRMLYPGAQKMKNLSQKCQTKWIFITGLQSPGSKEHLCSFHFS
jgi:hypothetical protein